MADRRGVGTSGRGGLQLLLLPAALLLAASCGDDAPDGPSPPPAAPSPATRPTDAEQPRARELLGRAMEALGGRGRLARIESVVIRFEAHEGGVRLQGRTCQVLPDRFRQEIDAWDCRMVHATDGEESWATLDGVRVPLEESDVDQLDEWVFLSRLSFLVGLEEEATVLRSADDEARHWLEVRPRSGDLGPYHLGFDRDTMLLSEAAWKTTIPGRRRRVPVTLLLGDYRDVSGVMVPFQAAWRVEGEAFQRTNRVTEVTFGAKLPPELFRAPEPRERAPVLRRRTRSFRAAVLRAVEGDVADAEQRIAAFIEKAGLARHGPGVRLLTEEGLAVGLPVGEGDAPPPAPGPPPPGAPVLEEVPSVEALTAMVDDATPEALAAAEERLRNEAGTRGLAPAGPVRHFVWREELVQVQLPVEEGRGR